ncbi:transcriptional regulator PhoU [Psychromonas sp. CNPT3]|uniref:phosphate signaling complex protein PhoU n=1 Tax=Psychromonas sp. CNPT3 TaxID=314282 RepID=UPI00006E42D4|nr:phosphate signaling complex protein PhoU [Psychromonas sp. CNPT3]AGH79993.1 transcriptional regulator PhoU [Psychromonas sp. CNPT3]
MEPNSLGKHISGQFNLELDDCRNQVLKMGGIIELQLKHALEILNSKDIDHANKIIKRDMQVNALEVDIDALCLRIIAKRQPAASDLRLIMAVVKTITDLERIGDVAVKIAKTVIENQNKKYPPLISIENMGERLIKMLHNILDAFARMDLQDAVQVYYDHLNIERQYNGIIRELMVYMMEDPKSIPQVLDVLWCVRALERISCRCQNISEYIIYFVKGTDVRHMDIGELEKLLSK